MVSRICTKCGTIKKSGKLSCCARGGSWFKNCGESGDTKLDHTWVEGIQACNSVASSVLVKAQPITDRLRSITPRVNKSRNVSRQPTILKQIGSTVPMSNTGYTDCDGVTRIVISVCFLLLISEADVSIK